MNLCSQLFLVRFARQQHKLEITTNDNDHDDDDSCES